MVGVAVLILFSVLGSALLLLIIVALHCAMQCCRKQHKHNKDNYLELPNGHVPLIRICDDHSSREGLERHPEHTPPASPCSTTSIRQPLLLSTGANSEWGSRNDLGLMRVGDEDEDIDKKSVLHYELGQDRAGPNRGTLTFALRYDFVHRALMVHVIRANGLLGEERHRPCEAYLKAYLLPERRTHGKTRICQSHDPEFHAVFSFDVLFDHLSSRMLQFTIYNFDRFTRHDLIGNVILRDFHLPARGATREQHWSEYTMQIVGNLLLFLSYSAPQQRLSVTVAKAYNLRPMDITGASDPYVKIEQIYEQKRLIKRKRTSTKRANLNPVYNECLEFDLPLEQVADTMLIVQVMDWDRIGSDDLLGCCILGKPSPTEEGRRQWAECFAPSNNNSDEDSGRPVGTWHSILDEVPEQFKRITKSKK